MTDTDTTEDIEDIEDIEYMEDTVVAPIEPILDADALTVARAIVGFISDKKGEKIILSDLRPVSVIAEFFVVAEAASDRQINAIVDHIREEVRKTFAVSPLRTEGIATGGWVLLDYGDVIVHLFDPDVRAYYDLEGLWHEAPILMRMQ